MAEKEQSFRTRVPHNPLFEPSFQNAFGVIRNITSSGGDGIQIGGISRMNIKGVDPTRPISPASLSENRSRPFRIRARLSRNIGFQEDVQLDFENTDGDSFISLPMDTPGITITVDDVDFDIFGNELGRLSIISAAFSAQTPAHARQVFAYGFNSILSSLSFQLRTPIYISVYQITDLDNGINYFSYETCFKTEAIIGAGVIVSDLMRPVCALYREALNNSSPAYRFFCYAKILEGLYKDLPKVLKKLADDKGVKLEREQTRIPHCPYIHSQMIHHVGTTVRSFYEQVVQKKNMRDYLAHFRIDDRAPCDLDDQSYYDHMVNLSYVTDLATRELIMFRNRQVMTLSSPR